MKKNPVNRGLLVAAALWAASPAFSASIPTVSLTPASVLWLVGDSTLHPFSSRTSTLVVTATVDANKAAVGSSLWEAILQKGALSRLQLVIPVNSIKSKESALDKNMYKTLNAESYPDILFQLSHYEVSAGTVSARASRIKAEGTLTIAGQKQPITLWMDASPEETGLRIRGHYTLLMTDYGIKPPTMLMGTIKVRNPIEVHFDLQLR